MSNDHGWDMKTAATFNGQPAVFGIGPIVKYPCKCREFCCRPATQEDNYCDECRAECVDSHEHAVHSQVVTGSGEVVIKYCSCGHRLWPPVPQPDGLRPVQRFIQTGALDVPTI